MKIYILYAHPAQKSFSREVLRAFTKGLKDTGHSYEINDLYQSGFQSDMDEKQYYREVGLNPEAPVPEDVKIEQDKIQRADALVFIYPVWWSDCPSKLKGWFDRVLTYGYAYFYDEQELRYTKIDIQKALVICPAGHTVEHLEEIGITESMRKIMLNDRLLGIGVKQAAMEILGGMMPGVDTYRQENLERAYKLGLNF
jgi:NAD(P)H dehydrogenase (quinone)